MTIVRAIVCMSADGYISRSRDRAPNSVDHGGWTSKEDKEVFRLELAQCDAAIVGWRTFQLSGQHIAAKEPEGSDGYSHATVVLTHSPQGIQLGDLSPTSGIHLVRHVEAYPGVSALDYLRAHPAIKSVLICGGQQIYTLFLPYIEYWTIVVEPIILGEGVKLVEDPHYSRVPHASRLVQFAPPEVLNDRGTVRLEYAAARVGPR